MCARDKLTEGFAPSMPNGLKRADLSETRTKLSRIAQYYRLKQKHNQMKSDAPKETNKVVYSADVLAVMTAYTKVIFQLIFQLFVKVHGYSSRYLPDLSKLKKYVTPSIILVIMTLVCFKQDKNALMDDKKMWKALYMLSFATHFGAQIWMTFISGIVLYFSIPRHIFGQIQEVLFPFYYLFNSIMSFIWVVSFINSQHTIPLHSDTFKQVLALTICLCLEVLIRLYVAKVIVMLKQKKTKIEAEAGTGQEIGHQVLGELVNCPHYMGILRQFRRLHSYTSVATIITVMCSLYHLNYVVDKLCL